MVTIFVSSPAKIDALIYEIKSISKENIRPAPGEFNVKELQAALQAFIDEVLEQPGDEKMENALQALLKEHNDALQALIKENPLHALQYLIKQKARLGLLNIKDKRDKMDRYQFAHFVKGVVADLNRVLLKAALDIENVETTWAEAVWVR